MSETLKSTSPLRAAESKPSSKAHSEERSLSEESSLSVISLPSGSTRFWPRFWSLLVSDSGLATIAAFVLGAALVYSLVWMQTKPETPPPPVTIEPDGKINIPGELIK